MEVNAELIRAFVTDPETGEFLEEDLYRLGPGVQLV